MSVPTRSIDFLHTFSFPLHPLEMAHLPHLEELRLSGCKRITGDVKVFRVGPPISDADGFYDSGNHHFDRGQVIEYCGVGVIGPVVQLQEVVDGLMVTTSTGVQTPENVA